MKRSIRRQPRARQDISEIALYLERQSPQSARRFLRAIDQAFTRLSSQPGTGARVSYDNPDLADLRVGAVERFKSHLIFYLTKNDRIEVIRVLHGARGDIERLLGESLEPT
ncbi:MAG TPA: type II toxin-antitoxin system RelE/ParE family toxin [Isosphaeraceae bacterium]